MVVTYFSAEKETKEGSDEWDSIPLSNFLL